MAKTTILNGAFRGHLHIGRIVVALFVTVPVIFVALLQTHCVLQGTMRQDHTDTLEPHRPPRIRQLFSDSETWSAAPLEWELPSQDRDGAVVQDVEVNLAAVNATPWRAECLRPWRSLAEGQRVQIACQQWALQEWPGNGALIYTCGGKENQKCGGLADRTRGMLFMYWLAVIRKSAFFIDLQRPTSRRLEAFWVPAGELNWTLPLSQRRLASEMEYVWRSDDQLAEASDPGTIGDVSEALVSNKKVLLHIDRNVDSQCKDVRRVIAMHGKPGHEVLRFSTTHQYKCIRQFFAKHHAKVPFSRANWTSTSNYLFKASPLLKSLEQQFKATSKWSPSNSVCIHLRAGGPIGPKGFQMADNSRTELPVRQTMYRCALNIRSQWTQDRLHVGLEVISKPSSYLVVADHTELLDEARQYLGSTPVLSTTSFGPMLHIDKVSSKLQLHSSLRKHVEMGEERAYLDHYLLSQCRYAIVDSSGFAWTALNFSPIGRLVLRPKRDNHLDMCGEADETGRI